VHCYGILILARRQLVAADMKLPVARLQLKLEASRSSHLIHQKWSKKAGVFKRYPL
jgi:hypothetical protein